MNCNNEQETMARFKPLTPYLSEKHSQYDMLRDLLRRVDMPPYQEF